MTQNIINLLGIRKKAMLARFEEGNKKICIMIEPITQEQEDTLDRNNCHYFIDSNQNTIPEINIYAYGKINFDNKDDLNLILNQEFIDSNSVMRSNFDYIEGNHNVIDKVRESSTVNIADWVKYNHCLIGKPESIIIYKINKIFL